VSEYKTAVRFVQSTWSVPLDGQTLDTALTANKILNSPCPAMADDSSFQLETLGSTLTDVIATSGLNRETSRLLGLQLLTPRPSQMHASALHIVGVAGQGLDCYRLTEILDSVPQGHVSTFLQTASRFLSCSVSQMLRRRDISWIQQSIRRSSN